MHIKVLMWIILWVPKAIKYRESLKQDWVPISEVKFMELLILSFVIFFPLSFSEYEILCFWSLKPFIFPHGDVWNVLLYETQSRPNFFYGCQKKSWINALELELSKAVAEKFVLAQVKLIEKAQIWMHVISRNGKNWKLELYLLEIKQNLT